MFDLFLIFVRFLNPKRLFLAGLGIAACLLVGRGLLMVAAMPFLMSGVKADQAASAEMTKIFGASWGYPQLALMATVDMAGLPTTMWWAPLAVVASLVGVAIMIVVLKVNATYKGKAETARDEDDEDKWRVRVVERGVARVVKRALWGAKPEDRYLVDEALGKAAKEASENIKATGVNAVTICGVAAGPIAGSPRTITLAVGAEENRVLVQINAETEVAEVKAGSVVACEAHLEGARIIADKVTVANKTRGEKEGRKAVEKTSQSKTGEQQAKNIPGKAKGGAEGKEKEAPIPSLEAVPTDEMAMLGDTQIL